MENLLLKNAKRNYESLLKEYQCLYQKVVGKEERIDHKVPAPEELLLPEHQPRVLNYSRQKTEGLKPLNSSCEEIFRQLLDECNAIYEPMQKLWTHFVNIIKISPRLSCAHYC